MRDTKKEALEAIARADSKLAQIMTCGDGTTMMTEARISLKVAFELVNSMEKEEGYASDHTISEQDGEAGADGVRGT